MREDKPCILSDHCPYLTAVCKVSEPDEGCYIYRYFKNIIDKDEYDKGMEDCWEIMKKIFYPPEEGLYYSEINQIFGEHWSALNMLKTFSAKEAKEKIDNYIKEKSEFHVGDEVKHKLDGFKGVVIEVVSGNNETFLRILFNGMYTGTYTNDKLIKTGRHFDEVETLIEKLKEE